MRKSAILLLHVSYWAAYLLLVTLFFLLLPSVNKPSLGRALFSAQLFGTTFLPALLGFYSFYLFLFERYLEKKKLAAFLLVGLSAAIVSGATSYIFVRFLGPRYLFQSGSEWLVGILVLGALSGFHGILALVVKGFIRWYGDIRLKKELRQRNEETELALLRSQTDPHFLFNTINNVDVLIQKDADRASNYLNKLSELLRFVLYEAKTEKIPLANELAYIEKYIDLQKIRSSNEAFVHYSVSGNPERLSVEPMLFIPFVENAFTHLATNRLDKAIEIRFVLERDKIHFECENNYSVPGPNKEGPGLGTQLMNRRLALLYPRNHQLWIETNNNTYKVNLSLNHVDQLHHN